MDPGNFAPTGIRSSHRPTQSAVAMQTALCRPPETVEYHSDYNANKYNYALIKQSVRKYHFFQDTYKYILKYVSLIMCKSENRNPPGSTKLTVGENFSGERTGNLKTCPDL